MFDVVVFLPYYVHPKCKLYTCLEYKNPVECFKEQKYFDMRLEE